MLFRVFALIASVTPVSAHEHRVTIGPGLVYSPASLTIRPGDSVRFEAQDAHPVRSDDDEFACYSDCVVRFERIGSHGYHCETHGGPGTRMAGTIHVAADGATLPIDARFDGVWSEPGRPGQGLFLHVLPQQASVAAGWFTWSNVDRGAHDWVTAVGPILGDRAELALTHAEDGRFDADAAISTATVGKATLRFFDCNTATLQYTRDDFLRSGLIDLKRLTPAPVACDGELAR